MTQGNHEGPPILVEVEDHVAHVTMNRPGTRNGFTTEMTDAFAEVFPRLRDTDGLAAVILTGAPGTFSAGGDMAKLANASTDVRSHAQDGANMHLWYRAYLDIPVPVIVAVDGPAFGGGLGLVLGADITLASRHARFSTVFPRIGLVAGIGTAWFLPRIVGLIAARELLLTGRIFDAEEASKLGMLTELHDDRDVMLARATNMAARFRHASSGAIAGTKELLRAGLTDTFDALVSREIDLQSRALSSPGHHAAARMLMKERRTTFDWDRFESDVRQETNE